MKLSYYHVALNSILRLIFLYFSKLFRYLYNLIIILIIVKQTPLSSFFSEEKLTTIPSQPVKLKKEEPENKNLFAYNNQSETKIKGT